MTFNLNPSHPLKNRATVDTDLAVDSNSTTMDDNIDLLGKHPSSSVSMDRLTFSQALDLLKSGLLLQRAGWNGKRMFIFLVPGSTFRVNRKPLLGIFPEGTEINYHPHIDMRTADGQIVPWLCSQTDMLAEDWRVVAYHPQHTSTKV